MSTLLYRSADGNNATLELGQEQAVTLGRDPSCDIVLQHPSVSRRQAVVAFQEGSYYIEDQNSKNGIFVNGERVTRHLLREGDVILLGLDTAHPVKFYERWSQYDLTFVQSAYDFSKAPLNDLKNLKRLIEINKAITTSLDLEEVLDMILKGVLEISSGLRAMVLLKDGDGEMKVAYQMTRQGARAWTSDDTLSRSVVRRVIETLQPVLVSDVTMDPALQIQASIQALELNSIVGIPLQYSQNYLSRGKTGDTLMGIIYVDNTVARRRFTQNDLDLMMAFSYQAAITVENARLHRDLQNHYVAVVTSLAQAVEVKDRYTRGHSELVSRYAVAVAEVLSLSEKEMDEISRGAILHDVGKIGIDENILNKAGPLTDEEFAIIRLHPVYGAQILNPVPYMANVRDTVLHHHERLDGSGYPDGLQGDQIKLGARIVSICDIFEGLTANRCYRKALPPEKVVKILESEAGSKLDPELVEAFLKLYRQTGFSKGAIKPRSSAITALYGKKRKQKK